jgi:integrase
MDSLPPEFLPPIASRPRGTDALPPIEPLTEQAYLYDWSRFTAWCIRHAVAAMPAHPGVVARFLLSESHHAYGVVTVGRRLAAIGYMHKVHHGLPPLCHPEADILVNAIAEIRENSRRKPMRKPNGAALRDVVRAISGASLEDTRDRALLALRASCAFRTPELTRLSLSQIARHNNQIHIRLGRFKANTARGLSTLTISEGQALRPVGLLECWLRESGVREGTVFRRISNGTATTEPMTEAMVSDVIAHRIRAAGYEARVPAQAATSAFAEKRRGNARAF